jgi:cytochrome b involved in lipid metabolism
MKKIILSLVGIAIVLGGGWFYKSWTTYAPTTYVTDTPSGSITTNTTTNTTSTTTPTYTLADIAKHNDATSCYSAISGSVYDLTLWINMHPGGKGTILSICGIDGTQAFMNQHHGRPKYMAILARFKIGVLQ